MTQQQRLLESLERVRQRRQETTQRSLEAATRAARAALQALQQRQREHKAVEDDIGITLQRPYEQGGAHMLQVQRGLRRVELLREHLAQARDKVQRAQAELVARQQTRVQALREHLRARHKHEAVNDQIDRGNVGRMRVAERVAQDALHDMAAAQAGRARTH
jgi:molybdopterin converting factor small subunit